MFGVKAFVGSLLRVASARAKASLADKLNDEEQVLVDQVIDEFVNETLKELDGE
jgi:hypothetical protein